MEGAVRRERILRPVNGQLYRWQVFVQRHIEEIVEVEAETEHEAAVAVQGPKDKIVYIRRVEEDGPQDQPSR